MLLDSCIKEDNTLFLKLSSVTFRLQGKMSVLCILQPIPTIYIKCPDKIGIGVRNGAEYAYNQAKTQAPRKWIAMKTRVRMTHLKMAKGV